jgi:hypothetical protein
MASDRPSGWSRGIAAAAWHARANELARWADARYVLRRDVAGGYTALEDRGREYGKADGTAGKVTATLTRPAPAKRGGEYLTLARLERHFRAAGPLDVLGTHTTSPDNTSWLEGAEDLARRVLAEELPGLLAEIRKG